MSVSGFRGEEGERRRWRGGGGGWGGVRWQGSPVLITRSVNNWIVFTSYFEFNSHGLWTALWSKGCGLRTGILFKGCGVRSAVWSKGCGLRSVVWPMGVVISG